MSDYWLGYVSGVEHGEANAFDPGYVEKALERQGILEALCASEFGQGFVDGLASMWVPGLEEENSG